MTGPFLYEMMIVVIKGEILQPEGGRSVGCEGLDYAHVIFYIIVDSLCCLLFLIMRAFFVG
jgi:hypothetical protein